MANPFKAINKKERIDIRPIKQDRHVLFDEFINDNDERRVAIGLALTTASKIRGMDFSDVDSIVFDEFIPERHVHRIKGEGEAFLHLYETVNRNRELDGEPPVRVYLLANAISLNNPILMALGAVSIIADMKVKGRKRYTDRKRDLYIELMDNAEFRESKSQTALYKLAGGTDFSEQALNNQFTSDDMQLIKKVPLDEYRPVWAFENYTVYEHKSNGLMHIAKKKSNVELRYNQNDADIIYWRFAPRYRLAILRRMVTFDDYGTKVLFDSLTSRH